MAEESSFKANFIKEGSFYISKDPSENFYRHFGIKRGSKLLLDSNEVLYIHSKLPPAGSSLRTQAYFELKNSDLNVLRVDEEDENSFTVFDKTKHFCRSKARPVALLRYCDKDERVEMVDSDAIAGVLGKDTYCFIKLQPVMKLDRSTPAGLYKQF